MSASPKSDGDRKVSYFADAAPPNPANKEAGTKRASMSTDKRKSRKSAAFAPDSAVLRQPAGMPPPLRKDGAKSNDPSPGETEDLFHYYALRGNAELMQSGEAADFALQTNSPQKSRRKSGRGGVTKKGEEDAPSRLQRLRPAKVEDTLGSTGKGNTNNTTNNGNTHGKTTSAYVQQREEEERKRSLAERKRNLALPKSEAYYEGLYYPRVKAETTTNTTTAGAGATAARHLRERHAELEAEIVRSFIDSYNMLHPGETLRRKEEEEAAARRRSTVAGGTQKKAKKKGAKQQTAPPPPPPGYPAVNLRFFLHSFLPLADEEGQVWLDRVIDTLTAAPFEVAHSEAISSFFFLIRQVSEAKGMLFSSSSPAHSPGVSSPLPPSSSVVAGSTLHQSRPPADRSTTRLSSHTTTANNTRRTLHSPTHGPSITSLQHHSSGSPSRGGLALEDNSVTSRPPPTSCVLLRELLAALDALLNSEDTKNVVRWECYQVFAVEGNGYIQKQQLETIKRHRRGEANTVFSPSIVKSLSDGFDVLAKEEEELYVKQNSKGKKKAKGSAALPPHQSSVIPLSVKRISHMDFKTFCRLFDALPQIPAAFTRVWLPLLVADRILPEGGDTAEKTASPLMPHEEEPESDEEEDEEDAALKQMQHARLGGPHPLKELGDTKEMRERTVQRVVQDRVGTVTAAIAQRREPPPQNGDDEEESEEGEGD